MEKIANVVPSLGIAIPKTSENHLIQQEQKATFNDKQILAADTQNPDVIRIAMFMKKFANGGAERVTQILTQELAKLTGYEVYLLTGEPTETDYPVGNGVIRKVISEDLDQKKRDVLALKKGKGIEVFICQEQWALDNYRMIHFLKENFCKVIAIDHGWCLAYAYLNNQARHNMAKLSYAIADAVCCLSNTNAAILRKENAKAPFFMPNPITFDLNNITQSTLENKNIIVVGRLEDNKNIKLAIQAMGKILEEIPDAKLQLLGSGLEKYVQECKDLAKTLGIEKSIEFCGFQTDIAKFYQNAAALLMTSNVEGWGMQMIEAKAYGLPVVALKCEYNEVTKKGTINVGKNDLDGMARETIKLLQNKEYREEQGRLARESLNDFKTEDTINKWDKLIRAVMQGEEAVQELLKKETPVAEEEAIRIAKEEFEAAKEYNPSLVGKEFDLFNK